MGIEQTSTSSDSAEKGNGKSPGQVARERIRAAKDKPNAPRPPRPPSPTRSIEPGLLHFKIAKGILTGVRERTGFNVGEFPESENVAGTGEDDPTRLASIVAHMVARGFDRIGFLRKFSRQSEGTGRRSGFVSDAFAAMGELYRRNPDAMQKLAKSYAQSFKEKQQARQQAKTQTQGEQQHASG